MRHLSSLLIPIFLFFGLSATSTATELTFKQAYQKFLEATESGDKENIEKFAAAAYELGFSRFTEGSQNLTNLAINYADALASNEKYEQAYELAAKITQWSKSLYGDESFEYIDSTLNEIEYAAGNNRTYFSSVSGVTKTKVRTVMENIEDIEGEQRVYLLSRSSTVLMKPPVFGLLPKKVERFARRSVEELGETLQFNDRRLVTAQYLLAKAQMALGKNKRAIPNFLAVISALDKTLEVSHPYELGSHAALVRAYEEIGKSEEATKHCQAIGSMTPWEENIEQTPLFRMQPLYPIYKARLGKEGWVKLSFVIDEGGFVTDAKVVESQGGTDFETETLEAIAKWRYAPKFVDGKPVRAESRVQMDFKLKKS